MLGGSAAVAAAMIGACWWAGRRGGLVPLLIGGAAWAAAIGVKAVLSAAVLGVLYMRYGDPLPMGVEAITSGLLTGVGECGVANAVVFAARSVLAPPASSWAFGAGFAAAENLVLGALSALAGGAQLLGAPSDPPVTIAVWSGPVFVIERFDAGWVHAVCGVLICDAVRIGRWPPAAWALALLAAMDAVPADEPFPLWLRQSLYALVCVLAAGTLVAHVRSTRFGRPPTVGRWGRAP